MTTTAGAVSSRTVKQIAEQLEQLIIELGASLGDDETLVRLKAREAAALLEQLDQVPSELPGRMPRTLEPLDVEAAIRLAALEGYAAAQRRFLWVVAERVPRLCTSMLRP